VPTLSVLEGFASHRRHNVLPKNRSGFPVIQEPRRRLRTQVQNVSTSQYLYDPTTVDNFSVSDSEEVMSALIRIGEWDSRPH
jgi:hypothetical protein